METVQLHQRCGRDCYEEKKKRHAKTIPTVAGGRHRERERERDVRDLSALLYVGGLMCVGDNGTTVRGRGHARRSGRSSKCEDIYKEIENK